MGRVVYVAEPSFVVETGESTGMYVQQDDVLEARIAWSFYEAYNVYDHAVNVADKLAKTVEYVRVVNRKSV